MKKYFQTYNDAVKFCANFGIDKSKITQTIFSWLHGEADVKVWTVVE